MCWSCWSCSSNADLCECEFLWNRNVWSVDKSRNFNVLFGEEMARKLKGVRNRQKCDYQGSGELKSKLSSLYLIFYNPVNKTVKYKAGLFSRFSSVIDSLKNFKLFISTLPASCFWLMLRVKNPVAVETLDESIFKLSWIMPAHERLIVMQFRTASLLFSPVSLSGLRCPFF